MVSQPTDNFFFGLFFIMYYLIIVIQKWNFSWRTFFAGGIGLLLSVVLYWIPVFLKFTWDQLNVSMNIMNSVKNYAAGGSGARYYTLNDFVVSPLSNMFDNPTGFGAFLFYAAIAGFIFMIIKYVHFVIKEKKVLSKSNTWMSVVFVWFVFSMIGTNGARLPFTSLYPYRFWSKLAIPVAILAGYAIIQVCKELKKRGWGAASVLFIIIMISGMTMTSAYPKYVVQTSIWVAHAFNNQEELISYTALPSLPINSRIYHLCKKAAFKFIEERLVGYSMYNKFWDTEQRAYKDKIFNQSANEIRTKLKAWNYEYLAVDSSCLIDYGINETNDKMMELINSGIYKPVIAQNPLFVLSIS
jgi:hypothetical protein